MLSSMAARRTASSSALASWLMSTTLIVQPPSGSGSEAMSVTWPFGRARRMVDRRVRSVLAWFAMNASPSASAYSCRPCISPSRSDERQAGAQLVRAAGRAVRRTADCAAAASGRARRSRGRSARWPRTVVIRATAPAASSCAAISAVVSIAQSAKPPSGNGAVWQVEAAAVGIVLRARGRAAARSRASAHAPAPRGRPGPSNPR